MEAARTLCPTANPIEGVAVNENILPAPPMPIVLELEEVIDITAAAPVEPVEPAEPVAPVAP